MAGDGAARRPASLVDKSLVQMVSWQGEAVAYRLLESMREYAREQLTRAGEAEAAGRAHALYILALTERGAGAALARAAHPGALPGTRAR
jgi:predicted ATPase